MFECREQYWSDLPECHELKYLYHKFAKSFTSDLFFKLYFIAVLKTSTASSHIKIEA